MVHPIQAPGVELITQEYLAASRQLRSRTDLTAAQRERLENELADEHRLQCARSGKAYRPRCVPTRMRGAGAYRNQHLFCVGSISHDRHRSILKTMEMTNQRRVGLHHEEAWALYLEAERRELEMRKEGHLGKILGGPLPDESPEELKRLAEDDRLRALKGLVALKTESGEIVYRPL